MPDVRYIHHIHHVLIDSHMLIILSYQHTLLLTHPSYHCTKHQDAGSTNARLLRQHHSSNSTTSTSGTPRPKTAAGGTDKLAKRDAVRCSYMGVCKVNGLF